MTKKRLKGEVASDKMEKTIVVNVERIKQHPKYIKRYAVHKKYKVHDADGEAKVGDKVLIEECLPESKDKRWRLVEIL